MHFTNWLLWAAVLFLQNISFTYVSRARSSGSIVRHLKASVFSNGIWIFSNMLMLGPMFEYLTGKHGIQQQIMTGAVYTAACVGGSIFAHYLAMKTEKGKNAVGYNKKYAQIPVEEWQRVQGLINDYQAGVADVRKFQGDLTQLQQDFIAATKISKANLEVLETLPTKDDLERVRVIALQAYDITVGLIPDSGVKAQKFDGATVIVGLPEKR